MKTIEEQRVQLSEQGTGVLQLKDEVQRLRCTLQEEQCKVEAVQLVKASDQVSSTLQQLPQNLACKPRITRTPKFDKPYKPQRGSENC